MDRERRLANRYFVELLAVMGAYAALLFARTSLLDLGSAPAWRAVVLLSPAVPIWGVFAVIARHYFRLDEYARLLFLKMVTGCSGVAACITASYPFAKDAFGLRDISIDYAWPVLGACWFVAAVVAGYRGRAMVREAHI